MIQQILLSITFVYAPLFLLTRTKIFNKSPTYKENCPILISHYDNEIYIHHPILKEHFINKIYDPHTIWIMLSEWLGKQKTKNEKEVPIGDNNIRILSHGFDLKTSFRH